MSGAASLRAAKLYGWTRTSAPGRKLDAQWTHPSGLVVEHCGHATALHPYCAEDARRPDVNLIVDENGRGFDTLERAFVQLARLERGELVIRIENDVLVYTLAGNGATEKL